MKRILMFLVLFVLVAACGHKDKSFMPNQLLTEREMIDIMTDVQIIEADLNYRKSQEKDTGTEVIDIKALSKSYYNQLFEHYCITDSIFSQNMKYYSEHPALLEKIMDSVTQRFVDVQGESSE